MKSAHVIALLVACGGAAKKPAMPQPSTTPTPPAAAVTPAASTEASLAVLESTEFALVMMACPLPVRDSATRATALSNACAADLGAADIAATLRAAFADATKELYVNLNGEAYKGSPALQLPTGSSATAEIEIPSVVDVVSRGFEQLLVDRLKLELQQVAQDLLREQLTEVALYLPATFQLLGEVGGGKQSLAETLRATLISDVLGLAGRAADRTEDRRAKIALTTIAAFLHGGDLTAVLQRLAKTAPEQAWSTAIDRAMALARYIRHADEIADNGLLLAYADAKAAEIAARAFPELATKKTEVVEVIAALRSARRSLHVMADASLGDETRARSIVAFAEQTLAAIDHLAVLAGARGADAIIDRGAITRAISAVAARDLPTFVAQLSGFIEDTDVRKALRLISMGAELSRAKSADAAAATLASFTTGTTNIRRRVRSVRISALVGGNAGVRWFPTEADNTRENVWQTGLSALIGIEASFPLSKTSDAWFGVTLTGFDGLAALTYDADSELDAGGMPATKFNARSFFAPGVVAQFGGKKLTAGLAFSVLPNAITVEMGDESDNLTVLRLLLTVGLTIPILELGTL